MRFRTMGSVKVFKPFRLVWRGLEPYPKTNTGTPREQPGKPPGTPREPPGTPREPPVTQGEFRNICRLAVMKLFSSQNIQIYSGKGFARVGSNFCCMGSCAAFISKRRRHYVQRMVFVCKIACDSLCWGSPLGGFK